MFCMFLMVRRPQRSTRTDTHLPCTTLVRCGYPRDHNNVSPRLGFSWAMDEEGRSALRGGFGVFYQRTSYTFLTPMFSTQARFSNSFVVQFPTRSEEHKSELQSLMRISYAVFCLKKKTPIECGTLKITT